MTNTYSLADKRIVITRAVHQATALKKLLTQYQAIPIIYPCIAIVPPSDTTALDTHLTHISSFDWVIFTSSNAVHALADRLMMLNIQPDWTQVKVAVVGSKTAYTVEQCLKHEADFMPDIFTGEALAETLPINHEDSIFIPQSALADESLAIGLSQRGAIVTAVIAYETGLGDGGADVPMMLKRGEIDAITVTSPSTVENFLQRVYPLQPLEIPVACIGSTTANSAKQIGFKQVLVPEANYTLQGMMDTLCMWYARK